jgi:hypothetical protein
MSFASGVSGTISEIRTRTYRAARALGPGGDDVGSNTGPFSVATLIVVGVPSFAHHAITGLVGDSRVDDGEVPQKSDVHVMGLEFRERSRRAPMESVICPPHYLSSTAAGGATGSQVCGLILRSWPMCMRGLRDPTQTPPAGAQMGWISHSRPRVHHVGEMSGLDPRHSTSNAGWTSCARSFGAGAAKGPASS